MTTSMMEDILFKLGDAYSASPLVACMMAFSSEHGFKCGDGNGDGLSYCQTLFQQV